MRRKTLIIISIMLIACSFIACGSNKDKENGSDSSNKFQNEESNKADDTATNQQPDGVDKDTTTPQQPVDEENNNDTSETNKTVEKNCRIFYYDFANDKMVYVNKNVEVVGGALVKALTNSLKDNSNNNDFITLNSETNVTSAKLDRDNDILEVYFDDSLNKSMNLGTNNQCELVDSIVYTYGYNYDVSKVAIYVNGETYIDPRGEMPGGYFTVDTSRATEYK